MFRTQSVTYVLTAPLRQIPRDLSLRFCHSFRHLCLWILTFAPAARPAQSEPLNPSPQPNTRPSLRTQPLPRESVTNVPNPKCYLCINCATAPNSPGFVIAILSFLSSFVPLDFVLRT